MKYLIFLAICLGFFFLKTQPSVAQDLTLSEFAFGYKIETSSKNASSFQFELPEKVYQTVVSSSLNDIRVFNSSMEIVPFDIVTDLPMKENDEVQYSYQFAKVFPLDQEVENKKEIPGIQITSKDGTLVMINSQNTKEKKPKIIQSYLIDASSIKGKMKSFRFDINPLQKRQYFKKLTLHSSDDLVNWSLVSDNVLVVDVNHQGQELVKDTFENQEWIKKYYRLSWQEEPDQMRLSRVRVEFLPKNSDGSEDDKKDIAQAPESKFNWIRTEGRADSKNRQEIYYDLPGIYPVRALRILFSESNALINFRLEGRDNDTQKWSRVAKDSFYSFIKNEADFKKEMILFDRHTYRYWRLTITSDREHFGNSLPKLEFGWRPDIIKFIARGNNAFYLAFGSSEVTKAHSETKLENFKINTVETATLTDFKELGGAVRLKSSVASQAPLKKYVLWGILVIAVFGLIKMSVGLLKSLNETKETPE